MASAAAETTTDEWQVLKFQSWASAPDAAFWQKLAVLKLHKFRLDDGPKVRLAGVG